MFCSSFQKIKKILALLLCAALLSGCGAEHAGTDPERYKSSSENSAAEDTESSDVEDAESSDSEETSRESGSENSSYADNTEADAGGDDIDAEDDSSDTGRYTRILGKKGREIKAGDEELTILSDELPLARKDYTVMVYMTGSNLESRFGAASSDLDEMRAADIDYSVANVIIYAGGSQRWNSRIPSNKNSVVELAKDDETWITAETGVSADMGSPATLSSFVNFTVENYPAEHYALILWDHGGGPVFGYGSDELYENDSLLLSEMKTAMDDTIFAGDRNLDFVGFDACLMANLETANIWKQYADYMIGSEELENGDGWDYSFLGNIGHTEDTESLAQTILEDYGNYYDAHTTAFSHPDATLSLLDLSRLDATVEALDTLCLRMEDDIDSGQYYSLNRTRNAAKTFGLAVSSDRGSAYDLIDLANFTDLLGDDYAAEKDALNAALAELVVAESTNVENTGGVSFYFPGDNQELYNEASEEYYSDVAVSDTYVEFLTRYTGQWITASGVDWTLGTPEKKGDEYTLQLTEEQALNASRISYSVLRGSSNAGYIYASLMNQLTPDENNVVHIPSDPELLTAVIGGKESDVPFIFKQLDQSESEAQYQSIGLYLSAGGEFEDFDLTYDETVNVSVSVNRTDGAVTIQSVNGYTDAADEGGKTNVDVDHFKSFILAYGSTHLPSYDENGAPLPFTEWASGGTYGSYSFPFESGFEFVQSHTSDYEDDFIIQVTVRDINGQLHGSQVTELEKAGSKPETTEVATDNGTLTFRFDGDEAELISYEGTDTLIEIPETVEGKPVTSIGENALYGSSELTTLSLPETLKEIGIHAFSACRALVNVNLPDSVTYIARGAFLSCESIEELTIPSSLERLDSGAFLLMTSLKKFIQNSENEATTVKDGVLFSKDGKTLISYPAAMGTDYEVPEGTEEIGYGAFAESSIEQVSFPETLRVISNFAFYDCYGIASLSFPESLEEIGERAFGTYWRSSFGEYPAIETISIGKNVSYIGGKAFLLINNVRFEVDPDNARYSSPEGYLANKEGDILLMAPMAETDEAVIPEGTASLQNELFYEYADDAEFTLPDSLVRIPDDAFPHTYSNETDADGSWVSVYSITIHCGEGSYAEAFARQYGIAYDYDIEREKGSTEQVSTAEGTCRFEVYSDYAVLVAYIGTDEILDVPSQIDGKPVTIIGNGKTSLDEDETSDSFFGASFTSVLLPDTIEEIRPLAFANMWNLEECPIPASVKKIGTQAFHGTNIKEFSVDAGNTEYCAIDGMLYTADQKTLIAYPEGSMPEKQSLIIPDGTEIIADHAFSRVFGLSSVILPDTVKEIGEEAFASTHLEQINFPKSLASIGSSAFYGTSLKEAVLPNSLEELGAKAFAYCSSLKKVKIPRSVKSVSTEAFTDCETLSDVTISKGVNEIGTRAFYGCRELQEIEIPDSVTSVGDSAFAAQGYWEEAPAVATSRVYIGRKVKTLDSDVFFGRTFDSYEVSEKSKYLKAEGNLLLSADGTELLSCTSGGGAVVRIPEGVTVISANAFRLDSELADVYIPDSVRNIDTQAFSTSYAKKDQTGDTLRIHCGASSAAKIYADAKGYETVIED